MQDLLTCKCSCKFTQLDCKSRQLELNERTCRFVAVPTHTAEPRLNSPLDFHPVSTHRSLHLCADRFLAEFACSRVFAHKHAAACRRWRWCCSAAAAALLLLTKHNICMTLVKIFRGHHFCSVLIKGGQTSHNHHMSRVVLKIKR